MTIGQRLAFERRIYDHLGRIYDADVADELLPRLIELLPPPPQNPAREALFDQTDVMLIAYGDQVREPAVPPLESLRRFLAEHTRGVVSGLHLLPHYPSSSDDGFAVTDYTAVDPTLGSWADVDRLARDFGLMLDAVVNHTSASSDWFVRWRGGDPAFAGFYLTAGASADVRSVTRPRTSPLLTPTWTHDGQRLVWTTFSADQVDLDYRNPEVLLAVTEVLLGYLARGASMLRLDAVGFLWKQLGTTCLHLPETHEIIKLWRTIVDAAAPGTLLVTETNVPHAQNVSYFGGGIDEAHLVYQFALPPLTLAAFHRGDASVLTEWARSVRTPSPQTTYLNFLASHDGVGLRPVEDLLAADQVTALCAAVQRRGGRVSYRSLADGTTTPYELNTGYLDALTPAADEPRGRQVDRFVAAHSILLALAGVPAVYFHSLFGSRGWPEGADHTGQARTINRQRLSRRVLEAELADPASIRRLILSRLLNRISMRTREPAFHPAAAQHVIAAGAEHFAIQRTPNTGGGSVVCVHDVSGRPGRMRVRAPDRLPGGTYLIDLCDGSEHVTEADGTLDVDVPAYGVRWLKAS